MTYDGEVLSSASGTYAAVVLAEGYVEDPVQTVLDAPVATGRVQASTADRFFLELM